MFRLNSISVLLGAALALLSLSAFSSPFNISVSDKGLSFTEIDPLPFNISKIVIKNCTCDRANGGIVNVQIPAGVSWNWQNADGVVVSTDTNLINVGAGTYWLVLASPGKADSEKFSFKLTNTPPPVVENNFQLVQPDCGLKIGAISYSQPFDQSYDYAWVDETRKAISANAIANNPLNGLKQGIYYLQASLKNDSTCSTLSAPLELQNQTGPYFDFSSVRTTDATCRTANGSIRYIYVKNTSGQLFFKWEDSFGNAIGKTIDLFAVPKGKYRLKFKDASNCDTLVTPYFSIDGIGSISLDTSRLVVRPADCKNANGAITGISVANASKIEWLDINTGLIVSTSSEVTNRPTGKFQLLASNDICNVNTPVLTIPQAKFETIKVASILVVDPHCDSANGAISSIQFDKNPFYYRFDWMDANTNAKISSSSVFKEVGAGSYKLVAYDTNQCSSQIYTLDLKQFSKPVFDYRNMQIIDDTCGFGKGQILEVRTEGGGGSNKWNWINEQGNIIGSSNEIKNLKAGSYYAAVRDSFNCQVKSKLLNVTNSELVLASPVVDDQEVLKGNSVLLVVRNALAGKYNLFESNSSSPITSSPLGIIQTPPLFADHHYFIRYDSGTCSSPLKDVLVKIIAPREIMVPSAFSPNQDGHNDSFKPTLSGVPVQYHFVIYNRWARKVFDTNTPGTGWDGKTQQLDMDPGIYVWTCDYQMSGAPLQSLKGTVTLVR